MGLASRDSDCLDSDNLVRLSEAAFGEGKKVISVRKCNGKKRYLELLLKWQRPFLLGLKGVRLYRLPGTPSLMSGFQ